MTNVTEGNPSGVSAVIRPENGTYNFRRESPRDGADTSEPLVTSEEDMVRDLADDPPGVLLDKAGELSGDPESAKTLFDKAKSIGERLKAARTKVNAIRVNRAIAQAESNPRNFREWEKQLERQKRDAAELQYEEAILLDGIRAVTEEADPRGLSGLFERFRKNKTVSTEVPTTEIVEAEDASTNEEALLVEGSANLRRNRIADKIKELLMTAELRVVKSTISAVELARPKVDSAKERLKGLISSVEFINDSPEEPELSDEDETQPETTSEEIDKKTETGFEQSQDGQLKRMIESRLIKLQNLSPDSPKYDAIKLKLQTEISSLVTEVKNREMDSSTDADSELDTDKKHSIDTSELLNQLPEEEREAIRTLIAEMNRSNADLAAAQEAAFTTEQASRMIRVWGAINNMRLKHEKVVKWTPVVVISSLVAWKIYNTVGGSGIDFMGDIPDITDVDFDLTDSADATDGNAEAPAFDNSSVVESVSSEAPAFDNSSVVESVSSEAPAFDNSSVVESTSPEAQIIDDSSSVEPGTPETQGENTPPESGAPIEVTSLEKSAQFNTFLDKPISLDQGFDHQIDNFWKAVEQNASEALGDDNWTNTEHQNQIDPPRLSHVIAQEMMQDIIDQGVSIDDLQGKSLREISQQYNINVDSLQSDWNTNSASEYINSIQK